MATVSEKINELRDKPDAELASLLATAETDLPKKLEAVAAQHKAIWEGYQEAREIKVDIRSIKAVQKEKAKAAAIKVEKIEAADAGAIADI
jgi:hypothetical protein